MTQILLLKRKVAQILSSLSNTSGLLTLTKSTQANGIHHGANVCVYDEMHSHAVQHS